MARIKDVDLERNLTEKRLALEPCDKLRMIVFSVDPVDNTRSVIDVIEGDRKVIIRYFNKYRAKFAEFKDEVDIETTVG